mmetsp:Transcript_41238/g.68239  ORF Transcript_41238/g.68239 Transcript_41238/m.68239 type:complete len:412 (-) Transcript_41238:50-1285(-)
MASSMEGTSEEKMPLLAEEGKAQESKADADEDAMSYDSRNLLTFKVWQNLAGTVWTKSSLWKMMGILLLIALSVAASVAVLVKDPAKLNVARFQRISSFLEVVVGLLLGFFLSSSMQRWYSCTNGFLELFDAIRGLHMQLNAMGVAKDKVQLCLRYCVMSAYCLNHDLTSAPMTPEDRDAYLEQCWKEVTVEKDTEIKWDSNSKSIARLLPNETETLKQIVDPAQTLWVWITSLLSRMAADGEIPPIPTPTYGRVITMAEQAYTGIRAVRASIRVQPPYVHVQMMAALVLVNNIINAISIGLASGVTFSMVLASAHLGTFESKVHAEDLSHSLQDLTVSMILCSVGPFLYQALLEVAVCIAQPFAIAGKGVAPGRIPTEKLLHHLEKDLRDIEFMSKNLPWWEQAYFKPKN